MSVDYSNSNKPNVNNAYPQQTSIVQGEGAAGFTRVEEWIDPARLRGEFLFGIPLVSMLTREAMTDLTIKNIIRRAAAKAELETRIDITPVQRVVRRDWDRTKYLQGWNQIDLGVPNIQSLQEVSIRATNSVSTQTPALAPSNLPSYGPSANNDEGGVLYTVPLDWIDTGYFHKGIIHFVPLQTTFTGTGLVGGATMGAAAPLFAVFSKLAWIPNFWFIRFTSGFQENSIPAPVNELIGCYAAMEILSLLGPLNKFNSQSIGLDGASQSNSSSGNQLFVTRYNDLATKAEGLKDLIRKRFGAGIVMNSI